MQSMLVNDVWKFVELPRNNMEIGCKRIFKIKKNGDSNIERFIKVILLAKDFIHR